MQVIFHGGAGTVTGSCYLIEHDSGRCLIDCGLFQGPKSVRELNYRPLPFGPEGIDFLLLTHAHIDHSGLVPKLCKHGFAGPIHATEPTIDLASFMLPDSGYIQESEVERLNRRNKKRGRETVAPIYTRADAEACLAQMQALMAGHESPEPHRVHPGSRPLSLIAFARLDPATLGALVALYEHKVFVESVLWDVNPFDQWGVELGKKICASLLPLGEAAVPAELRDLSAWIAARR